MGRQGVSMQDGTLLVIGWDEPFQTWFAMHHDNGDPDSAPRVAIGYHPAEQDLLRAERPDAVIGPFPVDDPLVLCEKLIPDLMGIQPTADQPPCYYCGKPPWESNPTCNGHPYDRLKR
jgi:hypothetical protein